MLRTGIALVAFSFATISFAETQIDQSGIQAITYNDGVLFESVDSSTNYQLTVSGGGNSVYHRSFETAGYLFLDTKSDENGPLADGVYKYEAKAIPSFSISREESSKLRDRNVLIGKSAAKASPISGSFRILNGEVVDSSTKEDFSQVSEGASE